MTDDTNRRTPPTGQAQAALATEPWWKDPRNCDIAHLMERGQAQDQRALTDELQRELTAAVYHIAMYGDRGNPNGFRREIAGVIAAILASSTAPSHQRALTDKQRHTLTAYTPRRMRPENDSVPPLSALQDKGKTPEGRMADNKEAIYDASIEPLMTQIIAVCKQHGIAMLATFHIPTPEDADLCCTTLLPDGDGNNGPQHKQAYRLIQNGGVQSFGLMVTTGRNAT